MDACFYGFAVDAFDTMVDVGYPDRAEPVVNYFEDNFIGRPDRRGNHRYPVFPLTLWNVNQRVLESLPRTNNSVEGWHCGFQSSLQCSHPTLWKLLDQLIRENELHRLTVVQLLAGQTHKPKRVYRISNERTVNVVADYSNRTFVEFLDPERSLSATTVVLVLLVVVTHFRKMPKALLIRNGKLRNFAHTFVTSFPTDLYRLRFFTRWRHLPGP